MCQVKKLRAAAASRAMLVGLAQPVRAAKPGMQHVQEGREGKLTCILLSMDEGLNHSSWSCRMTRAAVEPLYTIALTGCCEVLLDLCRDQNFHSPSQKSSSTEGAMTSSGLATRNSCLLVKQHEGQHRSDKEAQFKL